MDNITININDYIDEDEKRELCRQAFMAEAASKAKDDLERIISNGAYRVVFEAVDQVLDGKAFAMIRDKVIERIEALGNYEIFRKASAWDKQIGQGDSVGQIALDSAVKNNSDLIMRRVAEIIHTLDADKISRLLEQTIYEVINDRIIGNKSEDRNG